MLGARVGEQEQFLTASSLVIFARSRPSSRRRTNPRPLDEQWQGRDPTIKPQSPASKPGTRRIHESSQIEIDNIPRLCRETEPLSSLYHTRNCFLAQFRKGVGSSQSAHQLSWWRGDGPWDLGEEITLDCILFPPHRVPVPVSACLGGDSWAEYTPNTRHFYDTNLCFLGFCVWGDWVWVLRVHLGVPSPAAELSPSPPPPPPPPPKSWATASAPPFGRPPRPNRIAALKQPPPLLLPVPGIQSPANPPQSPFLPLVMALTTIGAAGEQ